jgi:hypothetical protein
MIIRKWTGSEKVFLISQYCHTRLHLYIMLHTFSYTFIAHMFIFPDTIVPLLGLSYQVDVTFYFAQSVHTSQLQHYTPLWPVHCNLVQKSVGVLYTGSHYVTAFSRTNNGQKAINIFYPWTNFNGIRFVASNVRFAGYVFSSKSRSNFDQTFNTNART